MITLRRLRTVGHGRGAPRNRPARARPRLGVLVLALLTLAPAGCASFGDPCGGGLFSNCRILRRPAFMGGAVAVPADPCGEPYLSVPMEAAPALTVPGGELLPAPVPEPLELEPAPLEAVPVPTPTTGQASPNQKTLYETYKPPGGTTSSRRSLPGESGSALAADPAEPLVDLPPLSASLPPEPDVTPPVPPAAETLLADTSTPPGAPAPAGAAAPGELPPKPASSGPVSLAPGIARFVVVEPQLAGGSLPNAAGWSFLADSGYRTALDLRARDEVHPGDDAAALHAGLRYVALPVTPETINDRLLERFDEEITLAGSRPLYFFDDEGARAAVLWYLRRVIKGGLAEEAAAREVEGLGPRVTQYWLAAAKYLEDRQTASGPLPTTEPAPVEPNPPAVPTPVPTEAAPVTPPADPAEATPDAPVAAATAATAKTERTTLDPTEWRPITALALTALGLPLAFFARSAVSVPVRAAKRLATLQLAAVRAPKALPGKSDV